MHPESITLHAYRVRDSLTGKWRKGPCRMTPEEALERYGEGNYELVPGSEFVTRSLGQTSDFMKSGREPVK